MIQEFALHLLLLLQMHALRRHGYECFCSREARVISRLSYGAGL